VPPPKKRNFVAIAVEGDCDAQCLYRQDLLLGNREIVAGTHPILSIPLVIRDASLLVSLLTSLLGILAATLAATVDAMVGATVDTTLETTVGTKLDETMAG
jgi:hypothetical protein